MNTLFVCLSVVSGEHEKQGLAVRFRRATVCELWPMKTVHSFVVVN